MGTGRLPTWGLSRLLKKSHGRDRKRGHAHEEEHRGGAKLPPQSAGGGRGSASSIMSVQRKRRTSALRTISGFSSGGERSIDISKKRIFRERSIYAVTKQRGGKAESRGAHRSEHRLDIVGKSRKGAPQAAVGGHYPSRTPGS